MTIHAPDPDIGQLAVELAECLVIVAPEWFEREAFLDWRQGKALGQWCSPASWNPQERTGDYNDVFLSFDRRCLDGTIPDDSGDVWDGSDNEGLPDDIYETIGQALHERGLRYGLIWIKPM